MISPPVDPKFGRSLVVEALTKGQILSWIIIGGILLPVGIALVIGGVTRHISLLPSVVGGGAMGVLGLALTCMGLWELPKGARNSTFYERGVRVTRGGNTREVAYHDADVAYYLVVSKYGTERVLEVFPPDGSPVIRAGTSLEKGQQATSQQPSVAQIEKLRNIVVDAVAERMLEDLEAGRKVEWSRGVCLVPEGVLVDRQVIAWVDTDEVANHANGRYDLIEATQRQTLAKMKMIDRNFLPGWQVVQTMRQRVLQ